MVFLKQEKLYEAAGEFEWARALMPGHPDPKVNLGLTLEVAGQTGEAISSYTAALESYPGYLPAIQALARAAVRDGTGGAELPGWFQAIALRSPSASWRKWAELEMSRAPTSQAPASATRAW